MTAKYSTDADDHDAGTRWERDRQHVLAQWRTKPFVGHRHRHEVVEQRVVVAYTHGVGVDIRHEARSTDSATLPDEWAPVETIEVREYGARHDRHAPARWLDAE